MGVIYMDRNRIPISEGITIESQYNIVHPETFSLKMEKLPYKKNQNIFTERKSKTSRGAVKEGSIPL